LFSLDFEELEWIFDEEHVAKAAPGVFMGKGV
jgi:hypothetical protein